MAEYMTKQSEQTEVVKIRIGTAEKTKLEEIARVGERTLAGQIRLALREWLESWRIRMGVIYDKK